MKKVKGLRWWIIGLIGFATIINYVDRNALMVMWSDISRDLDLSKENYAAILTSFQVMYAIGQSVSGRLFDLVGTRFGFVVTIVVWSLACGLHSIARGLLSFSAVRGLLGLSEAGNWPGATKSNAEWFPVRERAFAQGIFNAGASLGAVISAPLIWVLYSFLGWRGTFLFVAALGLLWVIPWLLVNRAHPSTHPGLTEKERDHILSGQSRADQTGQGRVLSWKELLSYRQSWSVIASRFFLDPIWWMFVNWLPIYLNEQFKFDIKQIGLFAWIPYVGAAAGSLLGGWSSGFMISRGWSVNRARKTAITIGGLITLPMLALSAVETNPLNFVLLSAVSLFGFQVMINNIQTLPSDFFSGKSVGTLAGLGGTSAVAGVLLFSVWLVPAITKVSYVPFFIMGACLAPLGVLMIYLFAGRIERLQVSGEPEDGVRV